MPNAPRIRQRHALYAVSALMDLSMGAATFAIGRRAAELGATPMQLGLLGSIWLGVYSLSAPFMGRLSDRIGRRAMATTGVLVAAVSSFACAWTANIPLLLAITSCLGLGVACFWPSIMAWFSQGLSGPSLALQLSQFSIAWNAGLISGFGLSGVLFQRGPQLAFYLAAAGMFLIALLLLVPTRDDMSGRVAVGAEVARVPAGRGFRKTSWLSNFSTLFAMSGTLALFPQLATGLGIRADMHGTLLVFHRLASLGVTILWPFVRFWQTRLWPLWIAQAACVLGVVGVGFGTNAWHFGIALVVCGAALAFNYQTGLFFTLEEMSEKGKGSGIHEAMLGMGGFVGPLLAGWVGSAFNHGGGAARMPYFFCAAVLAAFMVIEMAVVAWRRRGSER